jgi:hypothetical protein
MSWGRLFRRKRSDAELQNEIETFLTEEAADNEGRGMSPGEARRQARIKFGNTQTVRESLWAQNSLLPLTRVGCDMKYAFRTLSRTAGFSIIAVAVMALCFFGTKPFDPVVLSGVIVTLLAVAVLACLAPAWRASRLDPMQALRTE